jgi:metal-responsive CopG/Arc/MetJ family transcriptional regulator
MKITISMPDEVYNKLEEDRGLIPRSTYIQKIIKESGSVEGLEEV